MYLRIANPGVVDPVSLTTLGVGTTRNAGVAGTIGCFSSGSKLAVLQLLRANLPPVFIAGNLRLNYSVKPLVVDGQDFQQVVVKYSGTDREGKNRSSTQELDRTLEWGVADWDDITMAPREFVANAIDEVLKSNLTFDEVEIELVDNIRAKKDWTQVYIPTNEEIIQFYKELNIRFLHFGRRELLGKQLLPKIVPGLEQTRVYKNGVLVSILPMPSVWDYNLPKLRLDESRNADPYAVKQAISRTIANADVGTLAVVIKQVATADNKDDLLETNLSTYDLKDTYNEENKAVRKENWQKAFRSVAGELGVASTGIAGIASHLENKGYKPFQMVSGWVEALKLYDAPTEDKILNESEKAGNVESPPTPEMIECTRQVWSVFETFKLTNGKSAPKVQGFSNIMNGGGQKLGYYIMGGDTIYLHESLGGKIMYKAALEECCHYASQSHDCSRDIQDWCFNLITEMTYVK